MLRGGTFFGCAGCSLGCFLAQAVLYDTPLEIVTVGSIGSKGLLVEEPLDAAAKADLVGMFLNPDGPTHLAMPATAQNHDGSARYTSRHHSQRPNPT